MPVADWGWLISPEELESWILFLSDELLVVNKPGSVVCHPSKHGPWSSLVGAARELLGAQVLHMPSRLDRETSGVLLLARTRPFASQLQHAIQQRTVRKSYTAILEGTLLDSVTVDQPIGRAIGSSVFLKRAIRPDGQPAQTEFIPLAHAAGRTLARIHPISGRLHQIRVHAAAIHHPVAADKIYGPDESLFPHFIQHGFDARLQAALPLRRQALHASSISFSLPGGDLAFDAPLASDMANLWLTFENS